MYLKAFMSSSAFAVLVISTHSAVGVGAEEAGLSSTPTPAASLRDIHLAEYAERHKLDRSILDRPDGPLTITNETLAKVGDRGTITSCRPSPTTDKRPNDARTPTPNAPDLKRRSYWRNKVGAQQDRVAQVNRERDVLKAKIDALEDAAFAGGRNATRLWARVEETKARLKTVETLLARERAKLDAVFRQARQEGAQPGWFR